jgi:1-acyl-sn-glycerol-3-phosphate acyltransferase
LAIAATGDVLGRRMRSFAFNVAYWTFSIFFTLWAAIAALRPGRGAVRRVVGRYTRAMVWAMHAIAGIKLEVRGKERLPPGGFILAPKHSSWGDGFCAYSQFDDLAFVTGAHLERFPLFRTVLKKLGAIVVDNCGGPEARAALTRDAAHAHAEGRRILIYPEGALAPVGVKYRYKAGVYHMARDFGLPVVPAASNLALFWSQEDWKKTPGTAVLEFLDPIEAGEDKDAFLAALEKAVEDRTAELIAEARGGPVVPAVLGYPHDSPEGKAMAAAAKAESRAKAA